jgi:hypothetical protein
VNEDERFGAENVTGAENIRGRENIIGAEDRARNVPMDDDREAKLAVAAHVGTAADELLKAAKVIERLGFKAAIAKGKGDPIELWGKDESLQELADRLKGIADQIAGENEAEPKG